MVETEQGRRRVTIFNIAVGAMEPIGKTPGFCLEHAGVHRVKSEFAFAEVIGLLAGFNEPSP